mgnify:CR=1 FL=1
MGRSIYGCRGNYKDEIIEMQSEIIDALYLELMQYKTMDEMEESKGFQLIKEVAKKRRRVENA